MQNDWRFASSFFSLSKFVASILSRSRKQERAHAARALPFVFSQKEAKRAAGSTPRPPFARHCGSGKLIVTNQPVRRDAQKLAASRRSNNLCARFFAARNATKKSPHEPRKKILWALPWPTGNCLGRSQFSAQSCFVKPYFCTQKATAKLIDSSQNPVLTTCFRQRKR